MGKLLIISGAGTGVASGIKTFRTDTVSGKAMWDDYDIERVCNYHSFMNDTSCYNETHEFYNKRRQELANVQPNNFHFAVNDLYKNFPGKVLNITTNVDDLLERAGIPHKDILHVHGYLPEIVYKLSNKKHTVSIGYSPVNLELFEWVKPNIVFFGENAPAYGDMYTLLDTLCYGDTVVVAGCSNQVINFNWELFPALNIGVKMIVVNPGINYEEQVMYEGRGVVVYREDSAKVFSDPKFIEFLSKRISGEIIEDTK